MASIIPGYNYDIFISYRQKDNKGDQWVSEFVQALKTELESTFKEEISVYFDINPHDGLLETHDVDESLKEKLKCLIFIPIISRTYCDPKAFAWEHEFKAFVEQASEDEFGLKVKLPNGNVASRVLPVQIHDLDNEDITQCESVLGGVLRGIEFIYKEAGVDKPLAPDDDEKKNLNNTKYIIQIVKVAHAIKEIINAIKSHEPKSEEVAEKHVEPVTIPEKSKKTTIIAGFIIVLALIVLGILFIPKLFKPSENLEKSIAVLPFKNDSPEAQEENTSFVNGLMEEILINLQTIKEFRVPGRTSVEQFRDNTEKTIPEIARLLNVNYLIEGSVQKYGDKFRLRVQLIKAKGKEDHLWAKSYEQELNSTEDIFDIQSQIAQAIANELKTVISPEEIELIENVPTTSLNALDYYQQGRDIHWEYWLHGDPLALKRAEDLYHKALENDPAFAQAYNGLAWVYWDKHGMEEYFSESYLDSVLILTDIALSHNPSLSETHVIRGQYYAAHLNPEQAMIEYDKALQLNPNDWMAYARKANLYTATDQLKAIENGLKAISLNRGQGLVALLGNLSNGLSYMGFEKQCQKYSQQYLELTGDSVGYYFRTSGVIYSDEQIERLLKAYRIDSTRMGVIYRLGESYLFLGNYKEALKYFEKRLKKGWGGNDSYHRLGLAYWYNGDKDKAEYYINKQFEIALAQINLGRPWGGGYYSYYDLAGIYAFRGEKDKAFEYLRMFNQKEVYLAHIVNFMHTDPFFDNIRDEPEFQQITHDVEAKYQAEHERIRKWLEENNML